jgi:hypothetical protein
MRSEMHSFLVPPVAGTPRGVLAVEQLLTQGLAALRQGFAVLGLSLWRGLEVHGQRRAQRQLLMAAQRYEASAPERSAMLRQAAAALASPRVP